jgi:hypothetical protein
MTAHSTAGRASRLPPLVAGLAARLAGGLVGAVMVSVAAAITLVALGYAVYAVALSWLSPAGASALTAFIFAMVTVILAILVPRLIRGQAEAAKARAQVAARRVDPLAIRSGIEIGLVVLASIADIASRRRGRRSPPRH